MPDEIRLTKNQMNVLTKLAEANDGLIGREFADIATVTHGKWEWGNGILKSLEGKGFVTKTKVRRQGVRIWKVTDAGRQALRSALPTPAPRPGNDALSHAQRERLRQIAESHPWPGEYCTGHATNDAIERRGLITSTARDRGWRDLRLTDRGVEVANEMFGMELVQPEDPREYSFD